MDSLRLGIKISLLFLWIYQLLYHLRLMYNALSTDKMKDDLKQIKREIQTISEKLKNQITSGEEDTDLIYHKMWKYNKVILYSTKWSFLLEGRQNDWITHLSTQDGKPKFLPLHTRFCHLLGVIDASDLTHYQLSKSTFTLYIQECFQQFYKKKKKKRRYS